MSVVVENLYFVKTSILHHGGVLLLRNAAMHVLSMQCETMLRPFMASPHNTYFPRFQVLSFRLPTALRRGLYRFQVDISLYTYA